MPTTISAARRAQLRPLALLLVILASPGALRAQAGLSSLSRDRVSGTASVLLKTGSIAGATRTQLGGWAGLQFSDNMALGGGGFALLKDVELEGSGGGTGFDLNLGYGGLFFRYWEPLVGPLVGEVGLLMGAGHAEVRDQLTRREVGSSNFLVAEAEMGALYRLLGRFSLGASVGYRLTAGVEGLPWVSEADLDAFTATVFLRVEGR